MSEQDYRDLADALDAIERRARADIRQVRSARDGLISARLDYLKTVEDLRRCRDECDGGGGGGGGGGDDERYPLERPAYTVPRSPDVIARPGDDLEAIIRDAAGVSNFVLGIEGVHEQGIRLQYRYAAHWSGKPMSIELLGMSDDAEIRGLMFGEYQGARVEFAGVYRLAVRNAKGTRAPIWDTAPEGRLIFREVKLYPDLTPGAGYRGMKWGFKLDLGCDQLIIDSCPRGVDPITGEPARYWEHWAYLTNIPEYYVTGNDMSGGNRTGIQDRTPGLPGFVRPTGPKLIEANKCNQLGQDWEFNNGGSAITVWESAGPLVIRGNECVGSKYGALAVSHQPPDQKPFAVSPEGHTHEEVYIEDNLFDSRGGDRGNAVVSSALRAVLRRNELNGGEEGTLGLIIDGRQEHIWGAPRCADVTIHDRIDAKTYDPTSDSFVDYAKEL